MKPGACRDEGTRSDMGMVVVLLLRDVQWHRAIGFAVDKLVDFRIRTRADFIRRTLRDNATASKHNHTCRDTKSARHIIRRHPCGHVAARSHDQGKLIDPCCTDWHE